jgi:hypothetical protein
MVSFYREASLAQKALLLDQVVSVTGYARKYAIGLLNHIVGGLLRRQPGTSDSEQQASVMARWRRSQSPMMKRTHDLHAFAGRDKR